MKLAVINHWYDKKSAVFWNRDGFLRMLQVLKERDGWDVRFFKKHEKTFQWSHDCVELHFSPNPTQQLLDWKPDVALVFADFASPSLAELEGKGIPIAQCYTGGRFTQYAHVPDIVFTESKPYMKWMRENGVRRVVQAFGTNTDLFKPMKNGKIIDCFYPATFALWKRHWLFAEAMKDQPWKALACGWWQPLEQAESVDKCREAGVATIHHQIAESMATLYNCSKMTILTADTTGGCQRSVLESMACGVPPIVMADSDMCSEYVAEAGFGAIVEPSKEQIRLQVQKFLDNPPDPQKGIDYIKTNYSEYLYADKVKDGILSIIK